MKLIFSLLASLTFSSAMAQQVPSVIGTWVGETNDAVIGAGTHYPGGKVDEIRFLKRRLAITSTDKKIVLFQEYLLFKEEKFQLWDPLRVI